MNTAAEIALANSMSNGTKSRDTGERLERLIGILKGHGILDGVCIAHMLVEPCPACDPTKVVRRVDRRQP